MTKYYAQQGQDQWLNENLFKNKTDGFFIDIGASNGMTGNNTFYFEQLGWNGVCVDANPDVYPILNASRKKTLHRCLFSFMGEIHFKKYAGLSGIVGEFASQMIKDDESKTVVKMMSITLRHLLKEIEAPTYIDLLSIDTEGSEFEILRTFDFRQYIFGAIVVEFHWPEPHMKKFAMQMLLETNGYKLTEQIGSDIIFVRRGTQME